MSDTTPDKVTLATIGGGAAGELFDFEMRRVLENIADINTSFKVKREITIKMVISPDEDREIGDVSVEVKSKLAAIKPAKSTIFFGKKHGQLIAVENNPRQPGIFDSKEQRESSAQIVALTGGEKGLA